MAFRPTLSVRLAILITAVYLLGCIGHAVVLGRTVYGDGRYYYAILRSLAVDRDLDFTDEFKALGVTEQTTDAGLPANKYTAGPALFWLPGYLTLYRASGGTGFEFRYQLGVALMSVGAALVGLLLVYRTSSRLFGQQAALRATVAVAGATNLLFYGSVDTVNSHAVSFLFASVLLSLAADTGFVRQGAAVAVAALMRPQDALGGLVLAVRKRGIVHWILIVLVAAAVYSIQIAVFWIIYGHPRLTGYLGTGTGERFSLSSIAHIVPVLFSPLYGLFTATPVILVSLFGIRFVMGKSRRLGIVSVCLAVAQLLTVALWSSWDQGASYGGRMFISVLPVVTVWLAGLFNFIDARMWKGKTWIIFLVLSLTVLNALRIVWFLIISP